MIEIIAATLELALDVRRAPQGLPAAHADLRRGRRQRVRAEGEVHLSALAGTQVDPLEGAEAPYRGALTGVARDVDLDHLVTVAGRRVLDRDADLRACRRPRRLQARVL